MVSIGEQIQSLRKQQHVTQSDLANAVGVTTQAVSKWECGGTPDADLLPAIADFFKVSIDQLYGRKHQEEQPLSSYVYNQLRNINAKERKMEAFRIIYAIHNACSDVTELATIIKSDRMELYDEDNSFRFGYLMTTDENLAVMSLMKSSPYAIFMPEPEEGYLHGLMPIANYENLFAFLGKPHCMEILFQLFQRKNGFTIPLLAKQMKLKEQVITPLIDEMVARKWLVTIHIDTEHETLPVYLLENLIPFLPMLLIAQDIFFAVAIGYAVVTREKPILYHNEHRK